MASPTLKVSNPNEETENPTPSMDKPKTVATALEEIYYRLGGTGTVPSGTDVATLTWAISELVGEGGGSSGGGTLLVTETWSEDGKSATLDKTYNQIVSALNNGQVVLLKSDVSSLPGLEETNLHLLERYGTNLNGVFVAYFEGLDNEHMFKSTSADGVLTYQDDIN